MLRGKCFPDIVFCFSWPIVLTDTKSHFLLFYFVGAGLQNVYRLLYKLSIVRKKVNIFFLMTISNVNGYKCIQSHQCLQYTCFHIRSMEVLTKCTQQKETADFLKVLLEVFGKLKL